MHFRAAALAAHSCQRPLLARGDGGPRAAGHAAQDKEEGSFHGDLTLTGYLY
jgi:hypothetical protein